MPEPMTLDTWVVVDTDRLVTTELDDELFAMDIEKGAFFGLDAVGRAIWRLAQAPATVGEIRDALVREYRVAPEDCLRDLVDFLGCLCQRGLVKITGAGSRDATLKTTPDSCSPERIAHA